MAVVGDILLEFAMGIYKGFSANTPLWASVLCFIFLIVFTVFFLTREDR